jgi:hypothetical protein
MTTSVNLVGNLTREPELRYTGGGQPVASFGLAVNRRVQNKQTNDWQDSPRAPEPSSPAGSISAHGTTRTAASGPRSKSSPTRSARRSAGQPRTSLRTNAGRAATPATTAAPSSRPVFRRARRVP